MTWIRDYLQPNRVTREDVDRSVAELRDQIDINREQHAESIRSSVESIWASSRTLNAAEEAMGRIRRAGLDRDDKKG